MTPPKKSPVLSNRLRARAEKLLAKTPREVAHMPVGDVQKLVHELQVHQIELEMQNEELRRTQLELEVARERLLLPYDAAPIGFLSLDAKGVIRAANLAAARLLKLDRVKLTGQKLTRFIAPESQDAFYLHQRQLFRTEEKQTCELHLVRTGGTPLIARLEIVVDRTGLEPAGRCLVVLSDISDLKQAEKALLKAHAELEQRVQERTKALQTSEAKFRGFVEAAPDGIVVVNHLGQIVLVNGQVQRLFGYAPEELSGQPLDILLPQRFRRQHAGHFQTCFTRPRARPMGTGLEISALRKNGGEFPVEITLSPVATEDGLVVFSAIRDITERKQAEETLRRSEHYLSNFFHQAPIGLVWLSASGAILRANQAQLDLMGCPTEDYEGHSFPEFCVEPAQGRELLKRLAAKETVRNLRLSQRRRDGAVRHLLVDAISLWSGPQFEYSSIFLRDITDRLQLERDILHVSELEHRRIAQDLHDGLGQLLVGAAYLAGTARQDLAAKSRPEAAQLRRTVEVINEALATTRGLARGLHPVEGVPDGLMLALEGLAARTTSVFQIRCQFRCRRPVLLQDNTVATHLFRIAQEAVTNAIKHGKSQRIQIRLTETRNRLNLTVRDNGSGLPARQRLSAGLGLRIMRHRAGMIGGSLVIQNESAGGAAVACTVQLAGPSVQKRNQRKVRNHV